MKESKAEKEEPKEVSQSLFSDRKRKTPEFSGNLLAPNRDKGK